MMQAEERAEFDEQPSGALNARALQSYFPASNTRAHGRWRRRHESHACVHVWVFVLTSNVEPWPQNGSITSSETTVGGFACVRQKDKVAERRRGFCQQSAFRVLTATLLKSTHGSMHTSAFPCLSVRGLGEPSKRGKDWPGACLVPLHATGGQGQIKTVRAF